MTVLMLSVTTYSLLRLSVTQVVVDGGEWVEMKSLSRQEVLGNGLKAISRWWSWSCFLLGLFSYLSFGFGCFNAPSARCLRRGKIGFRGQNASPVPFGPGPNACECAGWWFGDGPRLDFTAVVSGVSLWASCW